MLVLKLQNLTSALLLPEVIVIRLASLESRLLSRVSLIKEFKELLKYCTLKHMWFLSNSSYWSQIKSLAQRLQKYTC